MAIVSRLVCGCTDANFMGQLGKQSIYGFVSSYVGMLLGIANKIFLFPIIFKDHSDYWGLLELFVAYATIIGALGHLGMPYVLRKYLPGITSGKPQLVGFTLIVSTIGCAIVLLLLGFGKAEFMAFTTKDVDVALLSTYYPLLLVLVALMLYLDFFGAILTSHYKAHLPIFLNNVVFRLGVTVLIGAFYLFGFSLHVFMFLYVGIYLFMLLYALVYLIRKNWLGIQLTYKVVERKAYAQFGMFSVLSGSSAWIVNYMDTIFVSKYLALSLVPILALSKNIVNVMHVPARAVVAASIPLVAKAWKERDLAQLQSIYKKTAIAEFLVGGIIFLAIWINVDVLLSLLPGDEWGIAKWVILALGIGLLADLSAGANMSIIGNSPYYKYVLWVNVGVMVAAIGLNVWLTPAFGIVGAAIALSASITLNNICMVFLLYYKEKLQPYTKEHLVILICFGALMLIVSLPNYLGVWPMLILKNLFLVAVSGYLLLIRKSLPEINEFINFAVQKVKGTMRKEIKSLDSNKNCGE